MTERPRARDAQDRSARSKLLVSLCVGVVAGVLAAALGAGEAAPLVGWDVLALTFDTWIWTTIWRLDPNSTRTHSRRENPGRESTDLILVCAGLASLIAVGVVLLGAGNADGGLKFLEAGLAVVSVFVSWATVHTVYTTRYASLYYEGEPGGVDFHPAREDEQPDYRDFAYLAFTVGMTFQVSDTDLTTKALRRTALSQALVSFPLGAVIIAATINLVSGLAK